MIEFRLFFSSVSTMMLLQHTLSQYLEIPNQKKHLQVTCPDMLRHDQKPQHANITRACHKKRLAVLFFFVKSFSNVCYVTDEGRSRFPEPVLQSTCRHDHRVPLQMCRPGMQTGKPSKAFLQILSSLFQLQIHFLRFLLPLLLSSPELVEIISICKFSYLINQESHDFFKPNICNNAQFV